MTEQGKINRGIFQNEVVALSMEYDFLIVNACTGAGKGRACFRSIEADKSNTQWLVVVPEIMQIENYRKDLEKHGLAHLLDYKIKDIICYASFNKYKGEKLNLHLNESHRLSELKADIADTYNYEKIIADSATIPQAVKYRLSKLGNFHTYRLSLKKAIELEILPEPNLYRIGIELDDIELRNEVKFGQVVKFISDKSYAVHLDKQLNFWKNKWINSKEEWMLFKMNAIGSKRKSFFAEKKTEILKKLLVYLQYKRYICFCGTIDQANEVGGKNAIHSKKTKKHNLEVLAKFNDGEIDSIFMNKMGREGMNLEDINAGIIVQLSTGADNGLEFIQSFGRAMRSEFPEFYILYCKDTKDEEFLNKALKKIDSMYVKDFQL